MNVVFGLLEMGLEHLSIGNLIMIGIGSAFIYLAISKKWEPYELLPIGCGIILVNLPITGLLTEPGPGVSPGMAGLFGIFLKYGLFTLTILPQLIFFCLGAMTDFGPLIANPKGLLLGAAAQVGIFIAFFGAIVLGFTIPEACSIGIIGGADGPTTIYTTARLAPEIIGITAVCAYVYMAMVAIIQPPIIRALTTTKERAIYMKPTLREVSKKEKVLFPMIIMIVVILLVPKSAPLIGMFMVGNLMRESGVVDRLSRSAQGPMMDVITVILMLSIGACLPAHLVMRPTTLAVLGLGLAAFAVGTASGVMFGKLMSKISKEPFNPMIGAAGVSAVPMSSRIVHHLGQKANPKNFLLYHAMGPNVAGVIGSAIVAGVFLGVV